MPSHSPTGIHDLAVADSPLPQQQQDAPSFGSDLEGGERPAKRPREDKPSGALPLACSECKRRKLKCDKAGPPCGSCIRRRCPEKCGLEEQPPRASIKSVHPSLPADTVGTLASRLSAIEELLRASHPQSSFSSSPSISRLPAHSPPTPSAQEAAVQSLEEVALADTFAPSAEPTFDLEDLTAARTSILSAPWTELSATKSSVSWIMELGLDFARPTSFEQLGEDWKSAMAKLHGLLPEKSLCYHLVAKYHEQLAWVNHILHRPSFDAEVDFYYKLVDEGRHLETCPIWLALYIMVLTLAVQGGWSSTPEEQTVRDFPSIWYAAAKRCLSLGDWQGRPQIRSILVILLFNQHAQKTSRVRASREFVTWLSSAIGIAHNLGLHLLGNDPSIMPPEEDKAFPAGANSLKRQIALVTFAHLCILDWMKATGRSYSHFITPIRCTSGPPANVNDADLSSTDWRISPASHSTITSWTLEIHRLRASKVNDKIHTSGATGHAAVMELDRALRSLPDGLPSSWTLESSAFDQANPQNRWKRSVCFGGTHTKLVSLHRRFLSEGLEPNSPYAGSAAACIKSAHIAIVSLHNIKDVGRNEWLTYSHALSASLALFTALFHALGRRAREDELEELRTPLRLAHDIFSPGDLDTLYSASLRAIVRQGDRLFASLFAASERVAQGRTGGAYEAPESFAEILDSVAKELRKPQPVFNLISPPSARAESLDTLPSFGLNLDDSPVEDFALSFFSDLGIPPLFPSWDDAVAT
ncbi:hypothetical protein BCR35DRAFT_331369 [Leucosporidium creatinivorum]|uniref:Zn(2)-C6 fungal-type domain-containing protein n=1 Tax=Leucosporidium creatinivorum TaxID=106004 RepID=A0A1Y2FHZ4_9BASI|nr:hypothetical protein BCR35DRAFT_331369 [Leucosporidium creatinivorum]